MTKCEILKVHINVTDMKETLEIIEDNLNEIKGSYICVSNVHTTVMAHENEEYRNIQNRAFMALPDGKPLSIISKKKGFKNASRVTGPDLMEEIFKMSKEKGYSHYLFGSTKDTLIKLEIKLKEKYPDLNIVGMYSPPFRKLSLKEDINIIKNINSVNPDFLWIGLGAPKQEIWMYEHRNKINSLMIGVGAGFDYHADNIKRAPKVIQKLSMEWFYRLCQDPKRLFRRYLVTNSKFLYLLMKETFNILKR